MYLITAIIYFITNLANIFRSCLLYALEVFFIFVKLLAIQKSAVFIESTLYKYEYWVSQYCLYFLRSVEKLSSFSIYLYFNFFIQNSAEILRDLPFLPFTLSIEKFLMNFQRTALY